jgi:hypothetical protein
MATYTVKYKIKGTGYLQFEANSEEEAREEFDRVLCGEECQNEANDWINQDVVHDLEWDEEVLNVSEC